MCEPVTRLWLDTLAGGLAGAVISTDELICGLESPFPHILRSFLDRFLGEYVQTSELRTAIRAFKASMPRRKNQDVDWQTFEDIHGLARRTDKDGFYRKSVALNYVRREVKFSWETDPAGGLEIFLDYLISLEDFLITVGNPHPSDFTIFRILSDFSSIGEKLNRKFDYLMRIADFEIAERLWNVLRNSQITAMQATVFGLSEKTFARSIGWHSEFENLARIVDLQHDPIAAAELIREMPNKVPDAPYREWLRILAIQGRATLEQPKIGGWWYVVSIRPRPA